MGQYQESLKLAEKLIDNTDNSNIHTYKYDINLLTRDMKAVVLQNQGLYSDAKKILENLIKNY